MIHCVRERDPGFQPDPGRARVTLKGWIVEYSGAVPTEAEVDAFLSPPRPVSDVEALTAALIRQGTLTATDIADEKTRGR